MKRAIPFLVSGMGERGRKQRLSIAPFRKHFQGGCSYGVAPLTAAMSRRALVERSQAVKKDHHDRKRRALAERREKAAADGGGAEQTYSVQENARKNKAAQCG